MADERLRASEILDRYPTELAEPPLTTAQIVGQFRTELIAEGIDSTTLEYLTQAAGRELIDGRAAGLCIKRSWEPGTEKEVSCDG